MTVRFRHPKPANGVPLEVELDHHGGLVSDDPSVVPRLDRDGFWSCEFQSASVAIFDLDPPAYKETDVSVHAEIGSSDRFHVSRPAESWRVNHPLDAAGTSSDYVQFDTTDLAMIGSFQWSKEHIGAIHWILR